MSEESKSWYRMTRPLFNSGFEDDEFWAYGQDGFQEVLDSFLGSDVLIYDKTIHTEPQKVRAIVQNKTSDVYNSTTVRQILCHIGVLRCGQYVNHEGSFWMVSALPDNNRIYEKAVLWKCKHTLRFLSPLTDEIVEYPVYSTNSTQYGTGEADRTHVNVGDDQHLIYLPYNEETILLDDRFRFIMDKRRDKPTVYRVTRVDPVSYAVGGEHDKDGLIQWSVQEDQLNLEVDAPDLMVADYYKKFTGGTEETPEGGTRVVLTDLDGDFKLACGETKQIVVQVLGNKGEPVKDPQYSLVYDFGGAASVSKDDGGIVELTASEDDAFVGKQIELKVVENISGSEAVMKIQIVNW